ncbi:hypothetical protein D3C76_1553660 [compost metagenome]
MHAAVTAGGAAVDDAGLTGRGTVDRVTLVALQVVFVGIDRNQQALGRGVQLREELPKFFDLARLGVDDQLVAVGADLAVLADEILRHR